MTEETTQVTAVTAEKIEQAKGLFKQYESVCEEEKQLDDMIASLRAKKSDAVKGIEALIGKGPFDWKGEELIITKRGDTYYFRGKGKTAVTKIG